MEARVVIGASRTFALRMPFFSTGMACRCSPHFTPSRYERKVAPRTLGLDKH